MGAIRVPAAGEEVDHYEILGLPSDGWERLNLNMLRVKAAFKSKVAKTNAYDTAALKQLQDSKNFVLREVLREFHNIDCGFARFKRQRELPLIRDGRISAHREDDDDGEERVSKLRVEFRRIRAAEYAAAHPEPAVTTVGEGSSASTAGEGSVL